MVVFQSIFAQKYIKIIFFIFNIITLKQFKKNKFEPNLNCSHKLMTNRGHAFQVKRSCQLSAIDGS
jgi:hypothetical protein